MQRITCAVASGHVPDQDGKASMIDAIISLLQQLHFYYAEQFFVALPPMAVLAALAVLMLLFAPRLAGILT